MIASTAVLIKAQDRPTFRSDISLVHVDACVVASDGRVLRGLSETDFRVFDERNEQRIIGFSREEQPLDLVLLFDTSGSMKSAARVVASASGAAFQELRTGDRVAIMTFDTEASLRTPLDSNLERIHQAILDNIVGASFGGGTRIQDAIDEAAKFFVRQGKSPNRRAILVVTDNLGTPARSEESIIRNLWEADAVVNGMIVAHRMNAVSTGVARVAPYVLLSRPGRMQGIAAKTGGETLPANDPASAFPEMIRRIRSRYSLYYKAPEAKPGEFRTIRVELAPTMQAQFPGAKVFARHGYRATAPPG